MTDLDPQLDDALRGRLLGLADDEAAGLSAAARERAMRTTLASANSARAKRPAWLWAGPLALAAAVALALFGRAGPDTAPALPAVQDKPVACDLGHALARAEFASAPGGERVLSIGDHARVLVSADASVTTQLAAPCRAQLGLESGTVRVHARALDGGELSVVTDAGEVVVRGTVFSVRKDSAGLDVALAQGHVTIEREGGEAIAMKAGERVRLRSGELSRLALSAEDSRALLSAFDLAAAHPDETAPPLARPESAPEPEQPATTAEPTTPAMPSAQARARASAAAAAANEEPTARPRPAATADELVMSADDARKAGELDRARQLYQRAGAQPGRAAEAAWLRLAQLELDEGRLDATRAALAQHERRFATGALGAEAAWLRVRLAQRGGDRNALRRAAEQLVERHPRSPQARAARRILADETR